MPGGVEWEMYDHGAASVQAQPQDLAARRARNGAQGHPEHGPPPRSAALWTGALGSPPPDMGAGVEHPQWRCFRRSLGTS